MPATPSRIRLVCVLALAACIAPELRAGMNTGKVESPSQTTVRRTEPVYTVEAGVHGEIFPAFANYLSFQQLRDRRWGTVAVTVANATDAPLRERIAVSIDGWSDREIQMVELAAGEVRTFYFAPTFLPRLYENREIAAATATVVANDMGGRTLFETTAPVRLRSTDDMYWGPGFKYAQMIASWVTPHDPRVEAILARAKESMPGRRLPGYETWRSTDVQQRSSMAQIKAIYNALKQQGVSYVKSSNTLGGTANENVSERVRMPYESLRNASANCIDGAVMYASLFENLGMDPVIVLVPGHAYVGVRLAEKSNRYLYLETALTGRAPFEAAVRSAESGLAKWNASQITRIAIDEARDAGVFPMPQPEHAQPKVMADTKR